MVLSGMILATSLLADSKGVAGKVDDPCGGWENFMTVTIEQQIDGDKCKAPQFSTNPEVCYHVNIRIFPGDKDKCTFDYDVPKSKVKTTIDFYVRRYL